MQISTDEVVEIWESWADGTGYPSVTQLKTFTDPKLKELLEFPMGYSYLFKGFQIDTNAVKPILREMPDVHTRNGIQEAGAYTPFAHRADLRRRKTVEQLDVWTPYPYPAVRNSLASWTKGAPKHKKWSVVVAHEVTDKTRGYFLGNPDHPQWACVRHHKEGADRDLRSPIVYSAPIPLDVKVAFVRYDRLTGTMRSRVKESEAILRELLKRMVGVKSMCDAPKLEGPVPIVSRMDIRMESAMRNKS